MRRSLVVVLVLLAVTALGACGDDGASPSPPPTAEAGPDGAVDGDAPRCADRVLYVSDDQGSDANDGCATTTPMKTIGAALAFVTTAKLQGHEIHVCRGTYREADLRIGYPVTMRGGYNCQTWTRGDAFGKKGGFVDPNATQLESVDGRGTGATLTVEGGAVGRDVVIEGIRIVGRDGSAGSVALAIQGGASPLVTDVQIAGGNATTSTDVIGSRGLLVTGAASPEVRDSQITGGNGKAKVGSVAVHVSDGTLDLHGSDVRSGSGVGTFLGASGIVVDAGGKATIRDNQIAWERPTADGLDVLGAIGVWIVKGSAAVTANAIRGGLATCHAGPCAVNALYASPDADVRVVGNVMVGGDVTGVSGSIVKGISVVGAKNAVVAANLVHAKSASFYTVGVEADAVDPILVGNTIVVVSNGKPAVAMSLMGDTAAGKGTGSVVDGNVLAANVLGADGVALQVLSCQATRIASVKNNLVLAANRALVDVSASGCTDVTFHDSAVAMEAKLGAVAANNRTVRPSCADASCVAALACVDANDCLTKVFPAFDAATAGEAAARAASGYAFAPTVPCALAEGGVAPPSGTAAVDVYGRPRTMPFSIGAAEQDVCAR